MTMLFTVVAPPTAAEDRSVSTGTTKLTRTLTVAREWESKSLSDTLDPRPSIGEVVLPVLLVTSISSCGRCLASFERLTREVVGGNIPPVIAQEPFLAVHAVSDSSY
jgi:hypothetical protein